MILVRFKGSLRNNIMQLLRKVGYDGPGYYHITEDR
jgi:hypothetical protein